MAEVKIGAELRQGAVTANGKGEVVCRHRADAQRRERSRRGQRGQRKVARDSKGAAQGVELVPFYDRTDLVKKAIHTVTKALEEGAIFVFIILIVLLADVRSAIIVTLVLPLAALFAFIMMNAGTA